jgi:hypothetical protein
MGALALALLFFVVDGFVMGFTGKSINRLFYPFIERMDKADGHVDTLGWDPAIFIFTVIIGALIGSSFGVYQAAKHRRDSVAS